MPRQELTRRSMYELVWLKPVTKVAEDFGISDVALKKICSKHRVPTPPRGYWAKKEAGKPVRQPRFFEAQDPQDERIVIHGTTRDYPEQVRQVVDAERERRKARPKSNIAAGHKPLDPVLVTHPAIAATARALRKARPDKDETVRATEDGHCGAVIGAASVERLIGILDALARTLEARGLALVPGGKVMKVAIPPDGLQFSILERVEKRKHVPTMEELAAEERLRKKAERDAHRGIWNWERERAYPEFDTIRTGELSVQIDDQYIRGLRRGWNDGKIQRLEALVDDIVSGIVTYLAGIKARREEREEQQRICRRRRQLQAIAQARAEREKRRQQLLEHLLGTSRSASELTAFLSQLRNQLPAELSGELLRLITWAESRLAKLESDLSPDAVTAVLRGQKLFPEPDDLVNPELNDDEPHSEI